MKERGFQISWWLIALELIIIFGFNLGYEYIAAFTGMTDNMLAVLSQNLTVIPIIIGTIILKVKRPYIKCRDMLGIHSFDITMLLFFIAMPIMAQCFASYAAILANVGLAEVFGQYDPGIQAPGSIKELAVLVYSACIAAPVLEELLFRGVIMKLLEPYGFLTAAIVSAIGFALLHLEPAGFIVIAFLGFILACIRYISGSVFACMAFHALSNFYSIVNLTFEAELLWFETQMLVFSVIAAVLFPIMFFAYKKIYPQAEKYNPVAERLGFSVGLFICVGIFIGYCSFLLMM